VALRQGETLTTLLSGAFYAAMTALIGAGLVASWSRGAWIGFAAAVAVMILFASRSPVKTALLVAGIAVVGLVLWSSGLFRCAGRAYERFC
jgi:hypothetical protein